LLLPFALCLLPYAFFRRHFLLGPEDAAPGLVFGNGHSALDADADPLGRFVLAREELTKETH
jgi:hypothetical protein